MQYRVPEDGLNLNRQFPGRATGTVIIGLDSIGIDARAHEVSDAVEKSVCESFPNSEVIIHQDPAGLERPGGLARS